MSITAETHLGPGAIDPLSCLECGRRRPGGRSWRCNYCKRRSAKERDRDRASSRKGHGEPTDAPPGSERKILVMRERAERGEPLFHPGDNTGSERAGIKNKASIGV